MAGPLAPGALRLQALGVQVEFGEAVRSSRGLAEMPVGLSALARTRKMMPQPLGQSVASWSKVRILLLALRMKLQVQLLTQVHLQFRHLLGKHIVPTTTVVLPSRPGSIICWNIRERDRGSQLVPPMNNLSSTTWLKVELVHLARNRYSLTNSLR